MKSKTILITGGAGFIGSNLTRKLVKSDYSIVLLVKNTTNTWRINDILNKIKIEKVDLLHKDSVSKVFDKYRPNIVYHLAANGAYSYQNRREEIFKTNINSTLNLLDSLNPKDLELFVNTGSSSEYGFKNKAMKETDVTEPNSYYAMSKVMQTNICNYYSQTLSIPIVTLRPFSVYGPYESPGRLIPNILTSFYHKRKLEMVNKKVARDFVYIDDYVSVSLKINLLKQFPGHIFNIGSGSQTDFGSLIKIAEKSIGNKLDIVWNSFKTKSWDTTYWKADISKAKEYLKFTPKYKLSSGLKKNWKWFKTNSHFYNENN